MRSAVSRLLFGNVLLNVLKIAESTVCESSNRLTRAADDDAQRHKPVADGNFLNGTLSPSPMIQAPVSGAKL